MKGPNRARRGVVYAGAVAVALAAVVLYFLREVLAPGFDRLPGTDAGNLYTWEIYTRSVLAEGRLPHWNPYHFGGTPHLADTQTTVLYPPALALRWLPPLAFLPWMAALHIWLAGAGTLFLGRVLALDWLPATAAALAVTLGGSIAPWLSNGHLLLIYCAAWLPWALGFAIVSVRRDTIWPHPLLVIVLITQFLAGYLQGSVYVTAAVCAYFVYSLLWPDRNSARRPRWRPAIQLGLAALLAAGIAAFQLLPMARLASEAARTAGVPYDVASRGGWTAGDLATLLFPFRGIDSETPHRWMSDRTAYVGWLLLMLAPVAAFDRERRRAVVFFGIVACVALALAFGSNLPLYQLHYALLPGFRIPGRALFVATLAFGMLGAIGLQRLLGEFHARGTRAASIAGTLALLSVGADLHGFWRGAVHTTPAADDGEVRRVFGAPDTGRAVSLCENRIGPHELLLNRQSTFDGVGGVYLRGYADWTDLSAADGPLPIRRDLLDAANVTSVVACRPVDADGLTLVSNVDDVLVYRNGRAWPRAVWTCAAEEHSHAEVIDQLRVGRYDADRRLVRGYLVNVRWAPGLDDVRRGELETRYRLHEPEHREGDTWRYRVHDLTREDIAALLRDPAVEDTHGLDRQTGVLVERAVDGGGERELLVGAAQCQERHDVVVATADRGDGVISAHVTASVPGVVYFVEPYFSERRAFVDDVAVPALRANVAFTAVRVPAGSHEVELRYVPSSFQSGAGISAATAGAWALGAVLVRRRRQHRLPPAVESGRFVQGS